MGDLSYLALGPSGVNSHICPAERTPNASASPVFKFPFSLVSSTDVQKSSVKFITSRKKGADNLDAYLLHLSAYLICPHLAHIFIQSFETGMIFPS